MTSVDARAWGAPFRIGATSYVIEAGLIENATFLAPHVQDMQLVLFDLPDGPSNLPDETTVDRLAEIGVRNDLSYTVHLMEDLRLEFAGRCESMEGLHPSLRSAREVIERTRALSPWAWVAHLDGRNAKANEFRLDAMSEWWRQAGEAVRQVSEWIGGAERLALENLEGYPADLVTPVVEQTQAGRCVDVGHLWLDGRDPTFHLRAAWRRLRVVHLHGVSDDLTQAHRDHRSLALMSSLAIDGVVHLLLRNRYAGIVTLEVFGEEDFWSSLKALHASIRRFLDL
ncbi:MAG: sugar phosphate isomerase/epimerase [Caldilinea sp.]|nr:sugar phosphate isomerase/epimerase [Caldilinea sp.]MDW8439300.1 cobamide remodeling phosphodiesterase CbiR [Caldilineaceae bacterium]